MRIGMMSDLHGHMPEIPPDLDLLIVAGDICPDLFGGVPASVDPDRQLRWWSHKWLPYVQKSNARKILVTWGNHDFCGQGAVIPAGRVEVVVDRLVEFEGLKIWMSPWSNTFMNWAFMKDPYELREVYAQIPEGVDILVSHQPPMGCGDIYFQFDTKRWDNIGSRELRERVYDLKPQLVVCGHLHKGYGKYLVGDTRVWNVSVVDEKYELVNPVSVIELERHDEKGTDVAEHEMGQGRFGYSPSGGWKWPVGTESQ